MDIYGQILKELYRKGNIFDAKVVEVYPLSLSTVRAILNVNGINLTCELMRFKAYRMGLKKEWT
jgi:molybdate transport system ATP-binding protein